MASSYTPRKTISQRWVSDLVITFFCYTLLAAGHKTEERYGVT